MRSESACQHVETPETNYLSCLKPGDQFGSSSHHLNHVPFLDKPANLQSKILESILTMPFNYISLLILLSTTVKF